MKFDVVVGNPPYQANKTPKNLGRTSIAAKLWPIFIKLSEKITNPGGLVLLVTPSTFIIKNNKAHKYVFSKRVLYLNPNVHMPGAGVLSLCYFLLKNEDTSGNQQIQTDKFVFNYDPEKFYSPYHLNETANNILLKTINSSLPKISILSHTFDNKDDKSENKTDVYKYPGYETYKDIKWFRTSAPYQFSPKVIIFRVLRTVNKRSILNVKFDENHGVANYYGNPNCFVLVKNEDEANNLMRYLNSKIINFIISSIRSSALINFQVLKLLPMIDFSKNWSDEDLYTYFNLTQEEIGYIQ